MRKSWQERWKKSWEGSQIREEEEEKLEWEREKQIREQLIEADRAKDQGQAALERKGKRGVDMSETERKDWDRQAVERQMALAEQRERNIGLMKGG